MKFSHLINFIRSLSLPGHAIILLFALALTVTGYSALARYSNPEAGQATEIPQRGSPQENVEVELVSIRPTGFAPEEIVRPSGRFLLALDNQSGLRQLIFRLEREGSPRVAEIRVGRKTEFSRILDLPAGVYFVREVNHPDWILRLRLTSR